MLRFVYHVFLPYSCNFLYSVLHSQGYSRMLIILQYWLILTKAKVFAWNKSNRKLLTGTAKTLSISPELRLSYKGLSKWFWILDNKNDSKSLYAFNHLHWKSSHSFRLILFTRHFYWRSLCIIFSKKNGNRNYEESNGTEALTLFVLINFLML